MCCAVTVQCLLITLALEADLTGVVMRANVKLKLKEGGKIRLVTHFASKPRPGCNRGGRAAAHVGDEGAIVEKHVLTNGAGENLSSVGGSGVKE